MQRLLSAFIFIFLLNTSAQAASLPDFTDLVEKVAPAVVNISTTTKIKRKKGGLPPGMEIPDLPEGSPWEDLFKHFFGEDGPSEEFNTQSLGSGFIIDKAGYIVTNNHVIREAEEIVVRLNDRRELKAKVIGSDPRSDVALLKIEADDLPVVKLADTNKIKVGEWVMAIGSPFGFEHSVSVGVVSAIGRNLPSENYVPFIQTDVAINPGNSGGPLFNLDGEVVGINSQIYSRTGGFMGLSFAIPMAVAPDVIVQLRDKGQVTRGWLGILIQDVNRELAESFNMEKPMGAVVLRVLDDSPAEKAKFQVGDVVVEFNGKSIDRSSDLPLAVGNTPVGKKVKVKVIREGKPVNLSVVIGELPSEKELAQNETPKSTAKNKIGVIVEEVSNEQRHRMEIKSGGVLVKEVTDGPALDAGIHRGDVILKIDGKDIKDVKQFNNIVKQLPSDRSLPVLVQRRQSPIFLALKITKD